MHDAVFCGTEEICGATETVEHSGAHDAGTVCVGIDIDLYWCVHADYSQATDDFRVVGDLLGA